ncbi:MAG: HAD hydrolase family protein [Sphaerochaetaceae bacterium]|nr:HAD hydrolase family protein [Spirochaetales bacterium]MDY5499728.1 HAD hydrolase family protein [Sphaerochaetaceae bacterium]
MWNKAIFCDVDMTLLPDKRQMPSGTLIEGLHQATKAGCLVVIATGRIRESVRNVFQSIEGEAVFACSNGGDITWKGQPISFSSMNPEDVDPMALVAAKYGCIAYISAERPYWAGPISSCCRAFCCFQRLPVLSYKRGMLLSQLYQVSVVGKGESYEQCFDEFANIWGRRYHIISSHRDIFDVSSTSKAEIIEKVCTAFQIPRERTWSFGDGENDAIMMRQSAHPYVMDWAPASMLEEFPLHCHRVEEVLPSIIRL